LTPVDQNGGLDAWKSGGIAASVDEDKLKRVGRYSKNVGEVCDLLERARRDHSFVDSIYARRSQDYL
jgi:hypothetical protein